jgi:nucleotide-binding universal stress UspA family protein
MAIRDVLLQLRSYPEHSPRWAVESAVWLAGKLEARLSAAICQTVIPNVSNWLADALVHAGGAIAAENAKSREHAQHLMSEFKSMAGQAVLGEAFLLHCGPMTTPRELAIRARSHDLTIVPVDDGLEADLIAADLVFESGRPLLLMPRTGAAGHMIETVAVGWDGSRTATRALADALPFCAMAKSVRLLQVSRDKEIDPASSMAAVQRHLLLHGIQAEAEEIDGAGKNAGTVLQQHALKSGADLLVMGAYGHSRAREFILGGATRTVLQDTKLPTLLSH